MKKVSWIVVIAGAVVGLAAVVLTHLGNPANMGFCIACFLRDITGAVGMHSAAKVQYVRPEIIGLVLGAFIMSVATKEFRAKAGSSPATRFVLGAFVMIGALAFLGCPLRMVLRMGGVPAVDASAMHALEALLLTCKENGITIIFSHVNEQPMSVMKKDGFVEYIGEENFKSDIIAALDYAESLINA